MGGWTIEHDWREDGWTPFDTVVRVTQDGASSVTPSVVNDRGRLTGQAADLGQHREWRLHRSALAVDSEIRSLWWGGSVWSSTGTVLTPQMLHVHRAQRDSSGVWRGIVVSNNVFLSEQNTINCNAWRATEDGLGFAQGAGAALVSKAMPVDRRLPVVGVSRVNFGGWVNSHRVHPRDLFDLEVGNIVQATSLDSTFTTPATGTAIAGIDSNLGIVTLPSPVFTGTVASKYDDGSLVPIGPRRYWPYWLASRLIGNVCTVKCWRYGEDEPEWGYPANVLTWDGDGANNPGDLLPDRTRWGYAGIGANHMKLSMFVEFGDLIIRQL